jgi:hypothetical protein
MAQEIRDTRLIAFAILGYIFCFFAGSCRSFLVVAYALAINKECRHWQTDAAGSVSVHCLSAGESR